MRHGGRASGTERAALPSHGPPAAGLLPATPIAPSPRMESEPQLCPSCPIPDCTDLVRHLCQPWLSCSLTPVFHGPHHLPDHCFFHPYLHSSTRQFFETHGASPPPDGEQVVRFEVHTDGSGGSNQQHLGGPPSWAWCLFSVTSSGRYICEGYLCECVLISTPV